LYAGIKHGSVVAGDRDATDLLVAHMLIAAIAVDEQDGKVNRVKVRDDICEACGNGRMHGHKTASLK